MRRLSSSAIIVSDEASPNVSRTDSHSRRVRNQSAEAAQLHWTVQRGFIAPLNGGSASLITRRELSALRAGVFDDAAERTPQCLGAGGEFAAEDEHDSVAFHLIGSSETRPLAACRLVRFRDVATPDFERRVGSVALEQILQALRVDRRNIAEVSRWIIDPRLPGKILGPVLIAGMWALAAHLRISVGFACAGTPDIPAAALAAMGGRPIEAEAWMKSEVRDEGLQPLWFDVLHPAPRVQCWVNAMKHRLELPDASGSRGS